MSFVLCRDNERERVNLKPLSLESHPSLILIAVPIFDTVMLAICKDDKLAENNHQPIFFKNSILFKVRFLLFLLSHLFLTPKLLIFENF